ncbi:MAG: ABC transporter permease subunit, partial [Cocleimonas sp.]|nr:ABC transporter permease subunit [Cocleimonas sp.]
MSEHNTELKPTKPPIWNDPKYRSLFFQVLLIIGVGYFIYSIVNNALTNMAANGVSTGFGFMSERAGFDILQSLIFYDSDSTYGRTFVVGILNTLLVTALGIFLATLLGFGIGIARLSNNWLLAKLATVYIEIFRNIPLLIQIFFWYIVVLRAMPSTRESLSLFDSFFLNVRGLYLPAPVTESGFIYTSLALLIALIAVFILKRWAQKRQQATGQQFPVLWVSLILL